MFYSILADLTIYLQQVRYMVYKLYLNKVI